MRRQTVVYYNECPNRFLGDFILNLGPNGNPALHAQSPVVTHLTESEIITRGGEGRGFSSQLMWLLSNVLQRTLWWLGFDTSPLRGAQQDVWVHHIMVGEGARPLKQDYCIAFNEGEAEPVCACSVCFMDSPRALTRMPCLCVYSVWSDTITLNTQNEVL